jgi:hypothetical protein
MHLTDLLKIKIGPFEIRGELLILIAIMSWILIVSLCVSCLRININIKDVFGIAKSLVEGFTERGAPVNGTDSIYVPPSPLLAKDLNIYPRSPVSPADNLAVSSLKSNLLSENVEKTMIGAEYTATPGYKPFQLPENELDMLASTTFKPECCPSIYSKSTGCACISTEQHVFLAERGGNNYPKSEY